MASNAVLHLQYGRVLEPKNVVGGNMRIRGFSYQDLKIFRWSVSFTKVHKCKKIGVLFDGTMAGLLGASIPNYRNVVICIKLKRKPPMEGWQVVYAGIGRIKDNEFIEKFNNAMPMTTTRLSPIGSHQQGTAAPQGPLLQIKKGNVFTLKMV